MLVYKYMPSQRFFSNFKLRFTPAEDLNDPKELVPEIRLRDPSAFVRGVTRRNIERTYFNLMLLNPNLTPAECWARCTMAAQRYEQQFDEAATVGNLYDMFMRTTNKNVGVLSLTEDPCIAPMWAHYAHDYKGLAIGLDSENEFFQPKPGEPKVCGQLMNVIYTDTSPVVYVDPGHLDIPKDLFFTKARSWEYEKEWRVIKYLPQASDVFESNGSKIHLFDVPPSAVKEVIFGSKVGPEVRKEVEDALQARAPHALIKRVTAVQGHLNVVAC